ncbi:hypothetical protein KC354_g13126 [Hortaea werneckii]|nr:hypothetical protein KC354_g13126 [Hortaea werneckii]KAI7475761.1 hypothetical protein KC351_g9864 [Hortaea werneckii]
MADQRALPPGSYPASPSIDANRPQHISDTEDSGSSNGPELASDAFDLQASDNANTFASGTQTQRSPSQALSSKRTLNADGVPSSSLSPDDAETKQEARRAHQVLIDDSLPQVREVATSTTNTAYVDIFTKDPDNHPELFVEQERL